MKISWPVGYRQAISKLSLAVVERFIRPSSAWWRDDNLSKASLLTFGHWRRQLWGTEERAPALVFQLFNFSGHFSVAQTLTLDSMWFAYPERIVTVYCMNLIIFCCVTLDYFLVSCPSSHELLATLLRFVLYISLRAYEWKQESCAIAKTTARWALYRVVQKKRYPSFNFAITSVNVHRL